MSRLPVILPFSKISFQTAVSALAKDRGFVAIDSRNGPAGENRFSIVASKPSGTFSFSGAFVTRDGHTIIDTPYTALKAFFASIKTPVVDPYLPFCGGIIGYIGHEAAIAMHGLEPARGFSRYPQCYFGMYNTVILFDHVEELSFVVSSISSESEANRAAVDLLDRLQKAPAYKICTGTNLNISDSTQNARTVPIDKKFNEIMTDARTWIRSDILTRIHLVRHTSQPTTDTTPVNLFLEETSTGYVRALFTHGDAYTIASSSNFLFNDKTDRASTSASPTQTLLSFLPSKELTGEPVSKAMDFLNRHEETHRSCYGGTFGTFDSVRMNFRTINKTVQLSDGAITTTSGMDLY